MNKPSLEDTRGSVNTVSNKSTICFNVWLIDIERTRTVNKLDGEQDITWHSMALTGWNNVRLFFAKLPQLYFVFEIYNHVFSKNFWLSLKRYWLFCSFYLWRFTSNFSWPRKHGKSFKVSRFRDKSDQHNFRKLNSRDFASQNIQLFVYFAFMWRYVFQQNAFFYSSYFYTYSVQRRTLPHQ